jgi:hypothetical protein
VLPPPEKEFSEGKLEEFNGKTSRGKKEKFTMEQKGIFYAELKGYAEQHGYKPGWAARKYQERFEVWPDSSIKHVAPIQTVSAATKKWIRSRQIAWINSQQKEVPHTNGTNGRRNTDPPAPMPEPPSAPVIPGTLCTEQDLEDFR